MIKKLTLIGFLIFLFYFAWLIPQVIAALEMTHELMEQNLGEPSSESIRQAGSHSGLASSEVVDAIFTAYTLHDEGVDCISASGVDICNWENNIGIIACPIKYDFGNRFEINGKYYICLDRMAPSLQNQERFDIFMGDDLEGAFEWGVRRLPVKIIR